MLCSMFLFLMVVFMDGGFDLFSCRPIEMVIKILGGDSCNKRSCKVRGGFKGRLGRRNRIDNA